MGDEGVGLFQDRALRDPGVHFDVGRDGAEFRGVGVLADLEHDVPAGQVAEGRDALAVERGPARVRRAERDQQHLVRGRRAGPAVRVRPAVETGTDEGHRVGVDPIGVRLHRARDQGEGPGGRSGERLHVRGGRAAAGEPPREPVPVRVGARQLPEMRRDLLLIAVPADERRGQLHEGTALRFGEGARGIGADVVEVQVGRVVVVGGAQLRQCLDGVVEEEARRGDGIGGPVVVRDGQRGGAGHQLRAGGLDPVGHERIVGVGDPVPAVHQLTDERQAGQDMTDERNTDHGDMGAATGHGRSLVSGAGGCRPAWSGNSHVRTLARPRRLDQPDIGRPTGRRPGVPVRRAGPACRSGPGVGAEIAPSVPCARIRTTGPSPPPRAPASAPAGSTGVPPSARRAPPRRSS